MLAVDTHRPAHLTSPLLSENLKQAITPPSPSYFILPDLVAYLSILPLSCQPNADVIAAESTDWLVNGCTDISPRRRAALQSLKAGQLCALCYPHASDDRFRVICDFIGFLFHLDNISDGMKKKQTDVLADVVMNALWHPDEYVPCSNQLQEEPSAGKLARDFWSRCISGAGPGVQSRFKEALGLFFEAVNDEAAERDLGTVPTMDRYIPLRRDNGGCKAAWALIEYGLGIDLPDYVFEDPIIQALDRETNDYVAWSNDVYSWNVEQARGDTTNMVTVVMKHHQLSLQQAIDYVGALCCRAIDRFLDLKDRVPIWDDEKVNRDVQLYIGGLSDWIIGSTEFNFLTDRYFGDDGATVKETRIVRVMEKKVKKSL